MTITTQMRQTAAAQALETLRALGREDMIELLWVDWKSRFTSRMGDALYATNGSRVRRSSEKFRVNGTVCRMRLSIPLWTRATETERENTVIHEICHLVAAHEAHLHGTNVSSAHGYEWKSVMCRAGVTPKRCHNVSNKGLSSRRRIPAKCACKDHELTPLVAGRILGGAKYTCRGCKAVIVVSSDLSQAKIKECREAVAKNILKKKVSGWIAAAMA